MRRQPNQYHYERKNTKGEVFDVIEEVLPGKKEEFGNMKRQTRNHNLYVSGVSTLPGERKRTETKRAGKSEEKKCICGLDYPDSSDEEDNKRRNMQSVPKRKNEPEVIKIREVEHIKIKNVENVKKKEEDEERIRIMEETRLKEIEEEHRLKIEEERRKLEEERKRIEEANRRRKEQEQKRKMDELRRKKEDDERRKQLEDEQRQKLEDERKRLEEEKRKLADEERRRKEEERRIKYEEEKRRKEAEEGERNKKRDFLNEQIRRLEEEERLYEEEMNKLLEEKRRFNEKQGKLRAPREKAEAQTQIIEKEEVEEGVTNVNRRFIYDEVINVYKTSETKTFYSEYVQKKYRNVQTPFPTRNTKTVVIGSNEANISSNTYIANRNNFVSNAGFGNNINVINTRTFNSNANADVNLCGSLCQDCQQREIYEQNMAEVEQSACPTCGRMTV